MSTNLKTVIVVHSTGMGRSDSGLTQKLLITHLRLLNESDYLPKAICFYADGVKLVVSNSPVLSELRTLQERGVHIIVCNTCLQYFNLQADLQVGIIGGMHDIIEAQWHAERVITL